jgi:hypothetical protein
LLLCWAGGAKATRSAAEVTTPRALRSEGGTTLFEMADDESGLRKLEKTPSKVRGRVGEARGRHW